MEIQSRVLGTKFKITRNCSGFSLMELMVVMAIIGIMSAVGFSTWQSSKRDSYMRDAKRELASVIKTAQSYALQGDTQGASGSKFVPYAYGIRFNDASTYEIFYYASSTDAASDNKVPVESFTFKNGIYTDITAGSRMYFTVPFGNMIMAGGFTGTIPLIYPGQSAKNVSVNSVGSVTE